MVNVGRVSRTCECVMDSGETNERCVRVADTVDLS